MAFDSGIQVASGDISSSNFADVVVSTTGNVPGGDVHIYKGATSTLFKSFQAIPGNTGGVNITVGSFSGDLTNEVVFASRGQGTGNVVIYNTSTRGIETTFSAFGNPSEPQPLTLYADTNQDSDPFVSNRIADVQVSKNAANQTFNLTSNFSDPNASNGVVNVVTTSGTVQIELLNQQAPVNVKNFMSYVDGNKYDGTIFHRSVSNFVVQGGGYTVAGSAPNTTLNHIVTAPPVANEYSVTRSNVRGTVAMAKVGNDPNSATSEFFFNVANNAANLDNQNGGFTVFANVKTGLDKVDAINAIPTKDLGGAFTDIPTVNNFTGTTVAQANASNFVTVNDMQVISRGELLTFSVIGNTNPTLVTPTIVGNNLTLDYSATATGSSVIQIRATDLSGRSVDTAFTVRVV
jgi:cyclophilin family peptidyl-prolyl cis-trans isomerase